MILRPFLHAEPVAISYLFGCGGRASGAVVDPVGDIEPYLRTAEASGMRILYVIDTHIHADHVSAGRRLASAAGARYVLGAQAAAARASNISPGAELPRQFGAQDAGGRGAVLQRGSIAARRDRAARQRGAVKFRILILEIICAQLGVTLVIFAIANVRFETERFTASAPIVEPHPS